MDEAPNDGSADGSVDGSVDGIVARGVRRSFGPVEAVRDISLTARPGEVTALVGPNGAGKTTLLLVLATLLVPDAGEIRIAGHDPVAEPDAVRANMGWTPDVFGVYDNLTASEYLRFFAAAHRLAADDARHRAAELLDMARLAEFADAPVHVLSRGQKQRLGLVRALVHYPSVLLLDEPASGLDPHSRVELRTLLRRLAGDGTAVVVSSHILADLEEMADRVVFVDRGRTVGEHRLADLPHPARRTWRIRSLDAAALLAALDARGRSHGEPSPAGVDVELASEEEAAALLVELVGAGVPVSACAPVGGALEAAYLELTDSEARR
jgi:ABC-2 type transport system ATP-binding protein